ncbi:carbamoyltransferase N-terminal domain-containing protein, partial [Oleiphilus sp. HI0123]
MYILGISAYYHDSAACLIKGGEIVAAVQEERFTRVKHDSSFPIEAIKYCLQVAQIKPDQIEYVTFYDKPFLKFERLLETYLAFAPKGLRSFATSMPLWVKDKLFQKSTILKELSHVLGCDTEWRDRLLFSEHHLSHAASAFYPSPFDNAAVLTMDGVGEWTTTSLAIGKGNSLEVLKEIHFPHSLGLLYSAFTYYTGFKVNAGEYKVMGLAPYGKPVYVNKIKEHLIDIRDDGSFQLNMAYFDYCTGLTMTNKRFHNLFGGPPRQPESTLTQKEMDLAASIQKVIEDVVIKMARNIASETGQTNLCLAGGVALNCVANGVLIRENIFENVWVQPASGDAGGSVGAALATYYSMLDQPRSVVRGKDSMQGTYLGPEFSSNDIRSKLTDLGASFTELNANEIIEKTASAL